MPEAGKAFPNDPAELFGKLASYNKDDVKGKDTYVAGYTTEIKDANDKIQHFLFQDNGPVQASDEAQHDDLAVVDLLATRGQDGSPAICDGELLGVYAGNQTE